MLLGNMLGNTGAMQQVVAVSFVSWYYLVLHVTSAFQKITLMVQPRKSNYWSEWY